MRAKSFIPGRLPLEGPDEQANPSVARRSTGIVSVQWRREDEPDGGFLIFDWHEADGPPVTPPARKGFGTELIERAVGFELNGEMTVAFAPSGGLRAQVKVPLAGSGIAEAGAAPVLS
jgi:two-component sensor histidine kinase